MAGVTERQERYRKDRREKGLCGWSACEEQSGDDYYCPIHKQAHAARMKLARQKAKAVAA